MKYDKMYMDFAIRASKESKCPRKQVGCAILLNSGLTATGFNGMASGGPNEWEFSEDGNPEVVHSELNALGKLLEQGVSAKDATVYVTLSPCLDCAKLLVRAKIKRVVYLEEYRKTCGVDYLTKYGVEVEKFESNSKIHSYSCGSNYSCHCDDNIPSSDVDLWIKRTEELLAIRFHGDTNLPSNRSRNI